MSHSSPWTERSVIPLLEVAGLAAYRDRAAELAPQLEVWFTLADELSRKMSGAQHAALSPITTFAHRPSPGRI